MAATGLLVVCAITFLFALIANRISRTIFTAPMIFLGLGYGLSFTGWLPEETAEHSLHLVAEITLIILLFLDASQIDLKSLRKHHV